MHLRRIVIPSPDVSRPGLKKIRLNKRSIIGIIIAVPILVIAAVVYFIWFSPRFVIDYVDIVGANGLDMTGVRRLVFAQMEQQRHYIFPQKTIWFFDSEATRHHIWEEYAISKLSIEKRSPNTLKINVFEEPFQAIWYTKGKYYKVDGRGIIIKEVDADLLGALPYALPPADNAGVIAPIRKPAAKEPLKAPSLLFIQDVTNSDTESGREVLSSHVVQALASLRERLAPQQIKVYYIATKPGEHDVEVMTTERWVIKINAFERIEQQIDNLRIVLAQRVKETRPDLEYVDVRFDNRIYIKKK